MAKYRIEDSTLTAIADAIRAKAGKSDAMTPAQMAEMIAAIQAGGGIKMAKGTLHPAEEVDVTLPNYYEITHGLGAIPDLIVVKVASSNHYPVTNTFVGLVMVRNAYDNFTIWSSVGNKTGINFISQGNTGCPNGTSFYVGYIESTATTKLNNEEYKWYAFRWEDAE